MQFITIYLDPCIAWVCSNLWRRKKSTKESKKKTKKTNKNRKQQQKIAKLNVYIKNTLWRMNKNKNKMIYNNFFSFFLLDTDKNYEQQEP